MIHQDSLEIPATLGVLWMFIVSGLSKLLSTETRTFDIKRLTGLNIPRNMAFYVIILVGVGEIVASGAIIQDLFLDEKTKGRLSSRSKFATLFLMAFTVVVTLAFYTFPPRFRPLMANTSTFCALMFIYIIIQRNTIQKESIVKYETISRVDKLLKEKGIKPVRVDKSQHGGSPPGQQRVTSREDITDESVNGQLQRGLSEC